jgi:hypothetical protein
MAPKIVVSSRPRLPVLQTPHERDRRADEQERVGGGQRHVQALGGIGPVRKALPAAKHDVRADQPGEEHHFRGEEQPDGDLAVADAGLQNTAVRHQRRVVRMGMCHGGHSGS